MQVQNNVDSALRSRGEHPICCAFLPRRLAPYLVAAASRVTECKGWVRVDVVFTLWHSVKRWSYVAIGGDDAANNAPSLFSLKG